MSITFEVFPAIGIARVGNSAAHFVFNGAETFNSPRRDNAGSLLRQAAEFRVYKCSRDDAGKLLAAEEMDASKASIDWTVHIANRKAAGTQFLGNGRRNNSTGNDAQDAAFIIDSGPQVLAGIGQSRVLQGAFMGQAVTLGDAMTMLTGRLLVLGGDGSAASPTNRPITNFADNDGWFDTVGDGVVLARVTPNGGQPTDALGAWVLVAPPDYAPPIANLVTMYDVLVDLAVSRNLMAPPDPVVFARHVRPILERGMNYQWVNMAARMGYADSLSGGHSSGGPGDFSAKMAQLGDPALSNQPRAHIFRRLRDPDSAAPPAPNQNGMPRLNDDADTGDVFSLTRTQYQALLKWSHGQFVTIDPAGVTELEPEQLTRAALESCSGGPFFPGIEAGRIMRDASRYMQGQAFRLSPDHVKPGEVTQGNAVPWQADFNLCRWEETDGNGSMKRLAWWPAQRPDDVLKDIANPPVPWARGIPDTFLGMIANWHRLGFVKADPANPGSFIEQDRDPALPP